MTHCRSTLYRSTAFLRAATVRLCLFMALNLLLATASAQDEDLKFYDNTYVDHIKTVRLHIQGFPHSYPVIELDGNARLRLSFDDTSDEVRRYLYKFIHCDQNWEPSGLSVLEYNSGYAEDYLDEYDFSLRTFKEYIHYDLVFPNRTMKLDVSGNYLLVVYDAEGDRIPVITRRFYVVENMAGVSGRVMRPADINKIHTHQEIDLTVNTKQLDLRAPMRELSASIVQNGRWDMTMSDIKPNLLQREAVRFDYQGQVSFRGGNEFRNLDFRSIQAPRTRMADIANGDEYYTMMMLPEQPRTGTYIQYFDLNGDFVNFRFDRPVINIADEFLQENFERFQLDFTGEYVEMTFILSMDYEIEEDIYIFGALSEWQLKPSLRMVWNQQINAYVGRTVLKQGFYNYYFVTSNPDRELSMPGDRVVYEHTEGSFDDAENDYLTFVYWRPIGGRYDRIVGYTLLNSNAN
ncbi:DUF5103 domain-containing protein [Lewinella sp. W8]|nr:DUF5103 domain-containing protein [Lewinella sp. W8]